MFEKLLAFGTSLLIATAGSNAAPINKDLMKRDTYSSSINVTRGVNLGGWFVLEPWITPSLFEAFNDTVPVDEYHLCEYLGEDEAKIVMNKHWDTFYKKSDFYKIAEYGFNTVRIPIGYWAFELRDTDPFIQGAADYLDKALEWSRDAGLKVWIDVHGQPGSQNGFDNSGLRGVYEWYGDNMTLSVKVLTEIAEKYGQSNYEDVVAGIELVNEPNATYYGDDYLKSFYEKSYEAIRNVSNTTIILHDGYIYLRGGDYRYYWNDYMSSPEYTDVIMDTHRYQFYQTNKSLTIDGFIENACESGREIKNLTLTTITGEWSAAMTDCTRWIDGGVGIGSVYDGTKGGNGAVYMGSCAQINDIFEWSEQKKINTRKFVEAQMDAYEQGDGWIFWTFKTERSAEWTIDTLIEYDLFPQPLTDRKYPNQCGY